MAEISLSDRRMAFIGGGNMAQAIIGGLLRNGLIAADRITVADPDTAKRDAFAESLGLETADTNREAIEHRDVIVLAIKPQISDEVMKEVGMWLVEGQLVISIMAGITTQILEKRILRGAPVVRVMPNTPLLVGRGATAICRGSRAEPRHIEIAEAIFGAVGETAEFPEDLMDAVTSLNGCGPGFLFAVAEALIEGGVAQGLDTDLAKRFAAQTLLGAGHLLLEDEQRRSAGTLREAVTSKGGMTEAGLRIMAERGVHAALIDAMKAATARGKELAGE
jgi:pyrroline-5-carboxylate reductase